MKLFRSIVAVAFAACSLSASAADDARAKLDAFAKGLDAVSGTFLQQVFDANGRSTDTSKGTLALKAPRQFRWQYDEPFPQLIVADGANVWIYDEDLEQVTVRPQSIEEAQSPLTVLTDPGQLRRDYDVTTQPDAEGLSWLRLTPTTKDPAFVSCDLGFNGDELSRMVVRDSLGQRNEMRFGRWQRNPTLDPALFQFTVPEGADLVGEPVKGAEAFPIKD
jgi:outer membrane lipoprotein carrier protein